VDTTRPQRKKATQEHLEKRFGEGNVDSGLQVQLEEDGGGSSRQSWMESSGVWLMVHWERQGVSHVKYIMYYGWYLGGGRTAFDV